MLTQTELNDWIGPSEAGRLAGCSKDNIKRLGDAGQLRMLRVGGDRLVHRADVEEWARQRAAKAAKRSATAAAQ